MMTIDELQAKWFGITSYVDGFLLVTGDHPLSFHIGYAGGEKCFIVLDTGYYENLTSSKAVTVSCVKTDDGQYALSFRLNYPSLDEIFIKLCWDLIDSSKNSSTPVACILQQYNSWLRLLHKANKDVLPSTLQKGLIAELLYLSSAITIFGEDDALVAWVGSEGGDQDFVFQDYWAEIKSTTVASNEVTISSLQQLERTDEGRLVVYFMDQTTATGGHDNLTLPAVVRQITNQLSTLENINKLECKLAKCGYFSKDKEKYEGYLFRLAETRTYIVDQTFPRLTRDCVPPSITSAKYNISLATIDVLRMSGG